MIIYVGKYGDPVTKMAASQDEEEPRSVYKVMVREEPVLCPLVRGRPDAIHFGASVRAA